MRSIAHGATIVLRRLKKRALRAIAITMNGFSTQDNDLVYELPSERRSVFARLTPLAWVALIATGVALGVLITLAVRRVMPSSNTDGAAASRSAALFSATATPTAAQSAVRAAVTATFKPTRTAVATQTPEPSATPLPPPPSPTAAPTATPVVAPWKAGMKLIDGGAWMADEAVVSDTLRVGFDYFAALRAHKTAADLRRDLLDKQDEFLGRYFAGNALDKIKKDLNRSDAVAQFQSGMVDMGVLDYSEDGLSASVLVRRRGWTVKNWTRTDFARWTLAKLPDQDTLWRMRYSPGSGWKVTGVIALPSLSTALTAPAAPAATAATKATAAPIATPVRTAPEKVTPVAVTQPTAAATAQP